MARLVIYGNVNRRKDNNIKIKISISSNKSISEFRHHSENVLNIETQYVHKYKDSHKHLPFACL